jgi:hypothetical protein
MTAPVLAAASLFDPTLPAAWAGILDALADLEAIGHATDGPEAERHAAAHAIHERLMRDAALLLEPAEAAADEGAHRRWFAEAVLLWMRLGKTSSPPLVDTLGARALHDFPVDLPLADEEALRRIRAGLASAFDWPEGELDQIERSVEHLTSNLGLKHRIAQALGALACERDWLSPAGRVEWMRAFYGPLPFRPGDVDVVMTSTTLFFCIPFQGTELGVPGCEERSEAERKATSEFLTRLSSANTAETKRFPAFGHFAVDALDEPLIGKLAHATECRVDVVRDTLATMVSILPTSLVEQYLVHDAWGHTWQEALNEFEWEYAALPNVDAPLASPSAAALGDPHAPVLASAFVPQSGRTELDEAALLRFAEADLRDRIQVATSAAFSEMLADAMESKYTLAQPDHPLPTSSLLPSRALKLDLTIGDLRRQLLRWTKPYRELVADTPDNPARAHLVASLHGSCSLPEPGLPQAVERAAKGMWHAFAPAFDGTLRAEPAAATDPAGAIRSSVLRRLLLQFVLVAAQFEHVLRMYACSTEPVWRDPATSPDFFAIAMARFYEHDRGRNFWQLDDTVRAEFQGSCARLKAAL